MNEAKYPTEPRIRQSAKPSDLDPMDTPRIGADRLHQQHISEPRIDDFATDDIALDLVIHTRAGKALAWAYPYVVVSYEKSPSKVASGVV